MRCLSCGADNIPGVDACEECGADLAGLDLPEAGSGFRGHLLTDRIDDLEITPPVTVSPTTTVAETIEAMRAASQGCALIVENGRLVGLFNERHVLTRVARPAIDPGAVPIRDVMSHGPLELASFDPPAFAVHCLTAYGFRHLPVVDGEELRGFISVRNILKYVDRQLGAG